MPAFTNPTIWNMDDAIYRRIDALLTLCETYFINWQLEDVYWTLRGIRREINAKLKKDEVTETDNKMKALEELRKKFLADNRLRGDFFVSCEEFYMYMNRLMKEHGMFLREGDDPRFAVLRR